MTQDRGRSRPPALTSALTPMIQRRRLGEQLRRLRQSCLLTGEQVATRLGCSQPKVSKIESGRCGIRPRELRKLLDIYGVTDQRVRDELNAMARSGRERDWLTRYSPMISHKYAVYIGLENAAQQITAWEPMVVHGLLQTEDYAREVIRNGPREMTDREIEQRVEIRMRRQAQIARKRSRLWMIMDQAVLRRVVGTRSLLRDQLRHVLKVSEDRTRVTIQLLPLDAGAHPGTLGALTVISFDRDPDVVFAETIAGDVYPENQEFSVCRLALERLKFAAFGHEKSVRLIEHAIQEL